MATLTGKKINTTYDGLLKTEDNQPISTTKKKVTDGYGNETGLSVDSLGNVDVSGALDVSNNVVASGSTTANSFIKTGGTSSQFLKADGSIDSNTYITSSTDTLDSVTDRGNTTTNAISVGDIQSSGNVTVTGTVDSRDIAADGSKLDGIEAGAEVNDVDSVFGRTGAVVANASDYSSFYPSITDLTTETNARISADTDLANDISTEATTRANNDLILQQNIDAEESARIAADSNLQSQVSTNEGDINNLDLTKQDNLTAGTGINIAGNTISNTAPDQTVTLTEGDNVTITGTYPNFTIASNDVVGAVSSVSAGTGISVNSTTGAVVVTNTITNNNQLTNGAGYTTNVGDITGVTAGTNLTGGGSSGTVTLNMATGGIGAGTYGSTANGTKIDNITVDAYGRVTGVTTGTTGDITAVTAGTNLTGGGASGNITLNLEATPSVTGINIGNQIQLKESTDRVDLLEITSVTSGWAGIQLRNSSNEGRWSLMTDGNTFGIYDDENSDWAIQTDENGEVRLYHNAVERFNTHSSGATVTGDLTISGGDIVLQGTGRIQGIDTVSASTDAANKAYVDNTAAALVTGVTAGAGLDGGGTSGTVSLSIESDLRGETWLIGRTSADYINVLDTTIDFVLDNNLDMQLKNNGDLHVDGDVIAYSTTTSDRRLKDNIKTIDNALDKVEQLRGVEYDWNKGSRKGQHEIGLIAQEVEEVFPFLVREKVKSTGDFENDDTAYKSVDYEKLIGVLIESVKELSAKVKTLEAKLQ